MVHDMMMMEIGYDDLMMVGIGYDDGGDRM